MSARSAWTGAISIGVGSIHVKAYGLTRSASSFKSLCSCHGMPIQQDKFCKVSGDRVARANEEATEDNGLIVTSKGVEVGRGKFVKLPPAAIESITASERSDAVEIERMSPKDSIPLDLSTGSYRMGPNEKIAGSGDQYNLLWNGLRANDQALVIEDWYKQAGSRPSLLVIHADEKGLVANTLPYATSLNAVPQPNVEENEDAAQTFAAFAAQSLKSGPFELSDYEDGYEARRQQMVEKAMNGEVIEVGDDEPAPAQVPDLLSALKSSLDSSAKASKKPARKKAPAKPKAKAKA